MQIFLKYEIIRIDKNRDSVLNVNKSYNEDCSFTVFFCIGNLKKINKSKKITIPCEKSGL